MKKKFFSILTLLLLIGFQIVKAQSTVYFFVDFKFWNSEYTIKINGKDAFQLIPKGEAVDPIVTKNTGYTMIYNMVARKVIFQTPGSYVVATDCPSPKGNLHGELNLNIEDGDTYYVVVNSTMKIPFYMELVDEKEGQKLLKKAQTNKKYTFNEDFAYDAK